MAKQKQPKTGKDRRVGDRRHIDLGGPPITGPIHYAFTRQEAIDRLAESAVDFMSDFDELDFRSLVINGWKGKPLSKMSNKELEDELNWDGGYGEENPDTYIIKDKRRGK